MRIAYMMHPYGGRRENLERAKRWFRWLIKTFPDVQFTAPWILWCETLEETPENRARGIAFDLESIRRSDEAWLVGGEVSAGMGIESREASERGKRIVDLTILGDEPPESTNAETLLLSAFL